MRYGSASAFRMALEQRLLTLARETNQPLVRLRKLVVFDRLLARLLVVASDRWVLKGALALDYRLGGRSRTTQDIDLARLDDEAMTTADFLAAQSVDLDDYFAFGIQKTGKLDAALEGAAIRYHARAELASRPFEDVIVDVGFRDPLVSPPDLLPCPDLLSFAGVPAIQVPALPLEQHVAEKVHAYTREYPGAHRSTRVKDLLDLVLICSAAEFQAGRLRAALRVVFEARDSHPLPLTLPPPPPDWARPYHSLALVVEVNPDVVVGYHIVAQFLNPILRGNVADDARWDPILASW